MPVSLIIAWTAFFFALGACIGSFLNVVIWRLPHRGELVSFGGKTAKLTLSWPPSHCPNCDAPIRWYQNIPILAWFVLRGKCANCSQPIAIRYTMVELATGLAFAGLFLAYFVAGFPDPHHPPFTDLARDWPVFLLHLFLLASLLAASAIDADWFIIPLGIPALLAAVALLAAPFLPHPAIPRLDPAGPWAMPTLGGAVGLLLANLLLYLKFLPQSFPAPSPEALEAATKKDAKKDVKKNPDQKKDQTKDTIAPLPVARKVLPILLASLLILATACAAWLLAGPRVGSVAAILAAIAIFLVGILVRDENTDEVTQEVMDEIAAPNARSEIMKEALFLALPLALALLGAALPNHFPSHAWLARLLGVLLGLLVGGAAVWLTRIGGSLLFGKEAMGLGDVHLMAGVGAILGAPLVLVAFFVLAPLAGIGYAIILIITRRPNVLPYGPWLSVASIIALILGKPLINAYLLHMFGPESPLLQ